MNGSNENARRWGQRTVSGLLMLGLILGFALSASADSHQGGWKTTGWIGYEGQGETDLDVAGTPDPEFDFWDIGGGLKSQTMLGDSVSMSVGGDYRVVGYNFDGFGDFKNPWGTVHVFRFNPIFVYKMDEKWSLIGGPSLQLSVEAGADVGDSLTGGGVAGVRYKWSETLSIALGLVVTSQIEDSARFQPFALITWGISDNLSFDVKARNSRGGEFRLSYALGDNWKIGIGGGFRRERFRLDNSLGGSADQEFQRGKGGVGEEEAKVVNLSVAYAFSETLSLEGYGGVTVDGDFRLEDEYGKKIAKSDYDNSGYGGLRINFGF